MLPALIEWEHAVPDNPTELPRCKRCGGEQSLAAARVAKMPEPGFLDILRCDECGATSARDRPPEK